MPFAFHWQCERLTSNDGAEQACSNCFLHKLFAWASVCKGVWSPIRHLSCVQDFACVSTGASKKIGKDRHQCLLNFSSPWRVCTLCTYEVNTKCLCCPRAVLFGWYFNTEYCTAWCVALVSLRRSTHNIERITLVCMLAWWNVACGYYSQKKIQRHTAILIQVLHCRELTCTAGPVLCNRHIHG